MLGASEDLERRRPVWIALSCMFLDTLLDDSNFRYIANVIRTSDYSPPEVKSILWDEVFPSVAVNLEQIAGEWTGFPEDWLVHEILRNNSLYTWREHPQIARYVISKVLPGVLKLLPSEFQFVAKLELG